MFRHLLYNSMNLVMCENSPVAAVTWVGEGERGAEGLSS